MKNKTTFTWSEGEYNEEGDAMHSDQCRQSTGSKCICPPLKREHSASEHTPTPWQLIDGSYIVANGYTVVDLSREMNGEDTNADAAFIVRAVNCHEELMEIVRILTGQHNCLPKGDELLLLSNRATKALAKAEASEVTK